MGGYGEHIFCSRIWNFSSYSFCPFLFWSLFFRCFIFPLIIVNGVIICFMYLSCLLYCMSQKFASNSSHTKYGLQSVLLVRIYWSQPCLFVYTDWLLAAFVIQWQSWVVATENTWPTKPKAFTVWTITEKIC